MRIIPMLVRSVPLLSSLEAMICVHLLAFEQDAG